MGTIGLTLLVSVATLAAIVVVAVWGANRATDLLIGNKHRQLEEITSTGDVPKMWRRGFERRLRRLGRRKGQGEEVRRVQEQAKAAYVRRLDELVEYASVSTLVADEETRELLLDRLEAARTLWESTPADGLLTGQ
jgi:hypothetical protein